MQLHKDVIASLAIQKLSEKMGAMEYFQASCSLGMVQYAFTKDCPPQIEKDIREAMTSITNAMHIHYDEDLWVRCPMNTVTRDQEMWDK